MNPIRCPSPLAALLGSLLAVPLAGCPDTTEYAGAAGPVGKLKLVQRIVASDDPVVTGTRDFLLSADGEKVYASSWNGNVLTFDRSPVDGSLSRRFITPLYNGFGIVMSPDGSHLYATGANSPDQVLRLDIDPVTGEPVPAASLHASGLELAITGDDSLLFQSSGGFPASSAILSYRIDPATGALTPGAKTLHDSPRSNFVFLVDDDHGTLFAERATGTVNTIGPAYIVRYAIDFATGALTREAETPADLSWGYSILARCSGTTRMYVPQKGNIGYADIGGQALDISSSFTHPDLAHDVESATLSPDCKNLYATTSYGSGGALVVLARDDAGDLSWLQTIPMGPGTPTVAVSAPWYARTSPDGQNVYVVSFAGGEGFAVFQRDTTGAGL